MSCTIVFNGSEYGLEEFKGLIKSGEIDPNSLLNNVSFDDATFNPEHTIQGVTRNYRVLPFRIQAGKIDKGAIVYSLQPSETNIGTYRDSVTNRLFNVFPMGAISFKEYLASRNLSEKRFLASLTAEEKGSNYMKEFVAGRSNLYIHRIEDISSFEDELPDIDDVRFARLYDSKMNSQRRLRAELKTTRGEANRQEIRNRIEALGKQMSALNKDESRTIAALLGMIEEDILAVEKVLNTKTDRRSLEYAKGIIYNYINVLSSDFSQDIDYLDEQTRLKALSFIPRVTKLAERIDSAFMSKADRIVSNLTGNSVLVNGLPIHTKDISFIGSYLKDTTENPNSVVQTLTKIIKDMQRNLGRKYNAFQSTNNKIVSDLVAHQKGAGLRKDDYYDYMLQVDSKGKRTGYFVEGLSHGYKAAKAKVRGTGKDEVLFYANNHTFTVDQEAWKVRRDSLIEYYKNNLTENIKLNDFDIANNITWDQKVDRMAKRWAEKRNPNTMLEFFKKAKEDPNIVNAGIIQYFEKFKKAGGFKKEKVGDDWVYVLDMQVNNNWVDPKWTAIQSMSKDDPRRVFYNHWVETINSGRKILSEEELYLPWNYIPEKTKDLGVGGNTRQWIVNNVSQIISQNIHGLDLVTGEIDKRIPVYMMNDTLSPENKSYNLGDVLDNFSKEVISYEEKSAIEDDANLLLYLISKQKVTELNPDGTIKTVGGKVIEKDGRSSNNFKMAQYRLNAALYDEKQDKEMVTNIKTRDVIVKRELKEIKDQMDNLGLTEDEKAEALQYLTAGVQYTGNNGKIEEYINLGRKYKTVSGNVKYITGNKIANTLIYYTSVKLLGLNLFGGFAEMLQGGFSLFTESASKRYFSDKNAIRGMGRVFGSMTPWGSEEKSRIRNISRAFDAQGKVFQDAEQDNLISKVAYWQWEQANFLMNNSFLFALLENETIVDDKGVVHKLADILNCNDRLEFSWSVPGINQNLHTQDGDYSPYLLDLMHKFKEVLKNNRERQTFEDPILLEKSTFGRLAGQFKKNWLFRAIYSRFGDYKEADLFSQKDQKGFYRSFFDLWKLPTKVNEITGEEESDASISGFGSSVLNVMKAWYKFSLAGKIAGADTSQYGELDEANLRKFAREVGLVMTITLVLICLSAGGGDDRKGGLTYAANQLIRLQRDLSTYMSPSSLASIVKNPFPVMSTVIDFSRLVENLITGRYFYDPYLNEGKENQTLRITKDLKRSVPFISQVDKHISKFNRTVTYDTN